MRLPGLGHTARDAPNVNYTVTLNYVELHSYHHEVELSAPHYKSWLAPARYV